ncbi:hypothetical protein [uncultured Friedmanniella sp.]|uniref:hypothetical protein n=1 Tax=uncultured Friedmanniella sp. TaxID=335381 RepID=UPI0035CBCC42
MDRGQWLAGRSASLLGLLEVVEASPAAQQFLDLPGLRQGVLDPGNPSVHSQEMSTGRALAFGLYAAWYKPEVLRVDRPVPP